MKMGSDSIFYLVNPGLKPAFSAVADHLWGIDANIDSDGNSGNADDAGWTELSLILRNGGVDQELHIDPVSQDPLVLKIRSPDSALAHKAVEFLHGISAGKVVLEWPDAG